MTRCPRCGKEIEYSRLFRKWGHVKGKYLYMLCGRFDDEKYAVPEGDAK